MQSRKRVLELPVNLRGRMPPDPSARSQYIPHRRNHQRKTRPSPPSSHHQLPTTSALAPTIQEPLHSWRSIYQPPTLSSPTATDAESHTHPDPSPPASPPSTADKNTPSARSTASARTACTDTARTGPAPSPSCTASTAARSCARSTPCGCAGSRSGM